MWNGFGRAQPNMVELGAQFFVPPDFLHFLCLIEFFYIKKKEKKKKKKIGIGEGLWFRESLQNFKKNNLQEDKNQLKNCP